MLIEEKLNLLKLPFSQIELGVVTLLKKMTSDEMTLLKKALEKTGLEIIEDREAILIENIKVAIVEFVYYSDDKPISLFSVFLNKKMGLNYTYLSNLFTKVEGHTIAHSIITHKIERVKELIAYNELTFSEIAFKIHYSSIAHLSNQFKKVVGITLSDYKMLHTPRILNLEDI